MTSTTVSLDAESKAFMEKMASDQKENIDVFGKKLTELVDKLSLCIDKIEKKVADARSVSHPRIANAGNWVPCKDGTGKPTETSAPNSTCMVGGNGNQTSSPMVTSDLVVTQEYPGNKKKRMHSPDVDYSYSIQEINQVIKKICLPRFMVCRTDSGMSRVEASLLTQQRNAVLYPATKNMDCQYPFNYTGDPEYETPEFDSYYAMFISRSECLHRMERHHKRLLAAHLYYCNVEMERYFNIPLMVQLNDVKHRMIVALNSVRPPKKVKVKVDVDFYKSLYQDPKSKDDLLYDNGLDVDGENQCLNASSASSTRPTQLLHEDNDKEYGKQAESKLVDG